MVKYSYEDEKGRNIMKITFLGTSHGVPSAERYCTCILVEVGESFYFIDAGAPIADLILRRGLDFNNFKAVFTTHAHGDHTAGIFQSADLMNWYYRSSSADFFMTDGEQADVFRKLIYISNNNRDMDSDRVRFSVAREGVVFDDGNIKVEYILNKHITSTPSYSILLCAEGKRMLFSGDLSNGLRENDVPTVPLCDGVDAFVCELAHFSLEELAPYIEDARIGRLFFTHVYPTAKYDDIEKIKGKYQFEVITPKDNDTYEV